MFARVCISSGTHLRDDQFAEQASSAAPWGRWQERRRTIGMNKAILGMALVLMAACAVRAQEATRVAPAVRGSENAAAAFTDTSAAQVNLFPDSNSSAAPSFALATPAAPSANPLPAAPTPAPAPAPKPTFVFGDRDDYRWQLGLGVEFFRFQSNIITASL